MSMIPNVSGSLGQITGMSFLLLATITYLCITNMLRFARMRKMQHTFGYQDRDSFATMTLEDAQRIQNYLYKLEFPWLMQKSLEFALFRTYGIPSVSKLLVQTTQLSDPESAPKRVEDTKILVIEFMTQAPTSGLALAAIARMNYIHSLYQKSGRISNDDMLYTLSLFALEPIRWVARYEWRELNDMEKCAVGVFWRSLGDAMRIDFQKLASAETEMKDGLDWLAKLEAWSISYEEKSMVADINNKITADQTTNILLWRVPNRMRGFGVQAVSSLMDKRLRKAMMYTPPHPTVEKTVTGLLKARKYMLRYLALPRPSFLGIDLISSPNEKGRLHKISWDSDPWYVEGSFRNRWSLVAWIDWCSGRPIPGDSPTKFKPEGFTTSYDEIGPPSFSGKGLAEREKEMISLKSTFGKGGGCPMAFGKA